MANLPLRPFLVKHPEPGPRPSTVVTRFLGTMGPSDSWPSPRPVGVFGSQTRSGQVSRVAHRTLYACRAHYPGGPADAPSIPPRQPHGLPHSDAGSASTAILSGPAQASLALRPAYLLGLLSRGLCLRASSPSVTRCPCRTASEGIDPSSGGTFTRALRCTLTAHITGDFWPPRRKSGPPLR